MKNFKLVLLVLTAAFGLTFSACKKEALQPSVTSDGKVVSGGNCTGYQVALLPVEHTTNPVTTIFTWTITNPTPGNGSGNTIQDLSHWNFIASDCLDRNWQDVLSASYFNGTEWINITNLDMKPDPSLTKGGCSLENVFKFDYGTKGRTPTQYRMVLNGNWGTADLNVLFKSGTNTGCCAATYPNAGIGCKIEEEDCSFSQGYWFANNAMHPNGVHPWNGNVTIGGKTYTNAEGLAIWNSSNKGGIEDSKKAFTQLSAILLSGVDIAADASLTAAVNTIECWLSGQAKLTPDNLPTQPSGSIAICGNAKNAADVISTWINANHCVEPE